MKQSPVVTEMSKRGLWLAKPTRKCTNQTHSQSRRFINLVQGAWLVSTHHQFNRPNSGIYKAKQPETIHTDAVQVSWSTCLVVGGIEERKRQSASQVRGLPTASGKLDWAHVDVRAFSLSPSASHSSSFIVSGFLSAKSRNFPYSEESCGPHLDPISKLCVVWEGCEGEERSEEASLQGFWWWEGDTEDESRVGEEAGEACVRETFLHPVWTNASPGTMNSSTILKRDQMRKTQPTWPPPDLVDMQTGGLIGSLFVWG